MKQLILIKLGGSVITDKSKKYFARENNILRLAKEIKDGLKISDGQIIVGHGGGSFPHYPAKKYKTKEGLRPIGPTARGGLYNRSLYGMCVTEDSAKKLDMILIKNFLKIGIPAFSFSPASFLISDTKVCIKSYFDTIKEALQIGIIPVVYGDVIVDKSIGCTIFSTEKVLSILAKELAKGYKIKMIYVTDVGGVLDDKGKVIPQITKSNFESLKSAITGAKDIDVTGGMLHKVEEALDLVKIAGIKTLIINGTKKNLLKNAILGKKVGGTLINV